MLPARPRRHAKRRDGGRLGALAASVPRRMAYTPAEAGVRTRSPRQRHLAEAAPRAMKPMKPTKAVDLVWNVVERNVVNKVAAPAGQC